MIINEIMDTIKAKKSVLVLGKDEKTNKKIYDNLISLFQKEKETRRLEEYLVCHIVGNENKNKAKEFTDVFLDFDCFYSISNDYSFFLNVGKLNSKE